MKIVYYLLLTMLLSVVSCSTMHKEKSDYGTAVIEFRLMDNPGEKDSKIAMQTGDYKILKMYDNQFQNAIQVILNNNDAAAFAEITSHNVRKYMSVSTDDQILVTAVIMEKIPDGKILITFPERAEADSVYDILCGRQ